jgi:transglutaminase-like putative cysteine protease
MAMAPGSSSWVVFPPPPTKLYRESNGNLLAYYELTAGEPITVTEVVTVQMSPAGMTYALDETMTWPAYDTESELYQKNTRSTQYAQANHPLIVEQARQIVGAETNPYRMARAIKLWVEAEIAGPGPTADALTVLQARQGDCAGHANLFAALCRAVGIPARNVSGLTAIGQDDFVSGCWENGPGDLLSAHVWSEFYLPEYGWVQLDTTGSGHGVFPGIPDPRLVLGKGNHIELGQGYAYGPLSWLTMPHANFLKEPGGQVAGRFLCRTVTQLPPIQYYVPLVLRK